MSAAVYEGSIPESTLLSVVFFFRILEEENYRNLNEGTMLESGPWDGHVMLGGESLYMLLI